MTQAIKLLAEPKQSSGTGSSRSERRAGRIPAIIYGGKAEPLMVSVSRNEFLKEYSKGGIKTKLIDLDIAGKNEQALVHAVQIHPVSDDPIHLDFLRVDTNTRVRVNIVVKILNEEKSPGVKRGGIINVVTRYIEVWCNPAHIPSQIEIDVLHLEIGQSIHIQDIKLSEAVVPYHKDNFTVVTVAGRASDDSASAAGAEAAATTA
jgi:large subunit ribosomal protein L25